MLSFDNLQDLFYLEIIAIYTGEYSASAKTWLCGGFEHQNRRFLF